MTCVHVTLVEDLSYLVDARARPDGPAWLGGCDRAAGPAALQDESDVPAGLLELTPRVRVATTLSRADNDLHERRFRDFLDYEIEEDSARLVGPSIGEKVHPVSCPIARTCPACPETTTCCPTWMSP